MALFIPPPSAGNPPWLNDHIWLDIQRQGGPQNTGEAEGSPPSSPGGAQGTLNNLIGINVGRQGGGFDPATVTVQLWVCNPTIGVGASNGNLASAGGASGMIATIPANSANFNALQTVHHNWFPTSGEVAVNNGHICIAANVYDTDGDGSPITSGPITLSDEHMAQRNISIVLAPAMFAEPAQAEFSFYIADADLLPEVLEEPIIQVEPVPEERTLTPVIQEQLLAVGLGDLLGGEPVPEAELPGELLEEPRERLRLRGGGELVLTGGDAPIHLSDKLVSRVALSSQKFEEVERSTRLRVIPRRGRAIPLTAHFEIEPHGRPGGVQEFDITLRGKDEPIGGIRVVVVTGRPERDGDQ
jgi:hypothetical protein